MDGDLGQRQPDLTSYSRVRPAVMLEILKQLGALNETQLDELSGFGLVKQVMNHRRIAVGESRPIFNL